MKLFVEVGFGASWLSSLSPGNGDQPLGNPWEMERPDVNGEESPDPPESLATAWGHQSPRAWMLPRCSLSTPASKGLAGGGRAPELTLSLFGP